MFRLPLALITALVLVSPAAASTEPPEALKGATLYRMPVQGMVCPYCAYNVEQRFNALEGVQYVDVNLDKGQVVVAVAEGHALSRSRAAALYKEAGFQLEALNAIPLNRENLANH